MQSPVTCASARPWHSLVVKKLYKTASVCHLIELYRDARNQKHQMLENIHHKSTSVSELTTLSNELKEKNKEENK
jgi:hypothetical protein